MFPFAVILFLNFIIVVVVVINPCMNVFSMNAAPLTQLTLAVVNLLFTHLLVQQYRYLTYKALILAALRDRLAQIYK